MLLQILEKRECKHWGKTTGLFDQKKKKDHGIQLPELLTLTCGNDTPGDGHRRQKQPWTNLLEKETPRELWKDIWPRLLLRCLYLRHFRRRRTRKRWRQRFEIVYHSKGDPFEGLQREHFLYTDLSLLYFVETEMFVTNIGSILKDGWLKTKAVFFDNENIP